MRKELKLPKYVSAFVDGGGITRFRFRKKGLPSHYFRNPFGTKAFKEELEECLIGLAQERRLLDVPETRILREIEKIEERLHRLRETHAEQRRPEMGLVYFIGSRNGPIKIGFSTNLDERLSNHQTSYHSLLNVLATIPGTRFLEREYHKRFAPYRLRGEWFRRVPSLVAEIKNINRGEGGMSISDTLDSPALQGALK